MEKNRKAIYKFSKDEKTSLKEEQKLMKQINKHIKKWVKVLSQLDDEDKQTLIMQLMEKGYLFDVSNQEKLSMGFQTYLEIGNAQKKAKKLRSGMKSSSKKDNVGRKKANLPEQNKTCPECIQNAQDEINDDLYSFDEDCLNDGFSSYDDSSVTDEQAEWRKQYFDELDDQDY